MTYCSSYPTLSPGSRAYSKPWPANQIAEEYNMMTDTCQVGDSEGFSGEDGWEMVVKV